MHIFAIPCPDWYLWICGGDWACIMKQLSHNSRLHSDCRQRWPSARGGGGRLAQGGRSRSCFRKAGSYHSRLQNIEYECWVFHKHLLPAPKLAELGVEPGDASFWRLTFDPETLQIV